MSKRNRRHLIVVICLCIPVGAGLTRAHATTLIDTTPGNAPISAFGEMPSIRIIGQTVTVPAIDDHLADFTFFIDDYVNELAPGFVKFQAYVYAWDSGTNLITGPALFTSSTISTTNNGGLSGLETIQVNTGNLALTPGGTYALLFSALGHFDGIIDASQWRWRSDNPYPGGQAFMSGSALNGGPGVISAVHDMEFKATFVPAPAPEPSSLVLATAGFVGLIFAWRRSKRF